MHKVWGDTHNASIEVLRHVSPVVLATSVLKHVTSSGVAGGQSALACPCVVCGGSQCGPLTSSDDVFALTVV